MCFVFVGVFVVVCSTHRDAQAVQAKLDTLIRAMPNASDAVAAIDDKEPEGIERHRDGHLNKY